MISLMKIILLLLLLPNYPNMRRLVIGVVTFKRRSRGLQYV